MKERAAHTTIRQLERLSHHDDLANVSTAPSVVGLERVFLHSRNRAGMRSRLLSRSSPITACCVPHGVPSTRPQERS